MLVLGAGAGTQSMDVSEDLGNLLESTVDDAVRDLSVNWLDVMEAHGRLDNQTVHRVDLMIRAGGTVDAIHLHDLIVRQGVENETTIDIAEIARDADGSLDDGVLNEGDLVRIQFPLQPGLERGDETSLRFYEPNGVPLKLTLDFPQTGNEGEWVTLETQSSW